VSLRVLFVCTGNICRSPMAQRLFTERVPAQLAVASSAGTRALVGYPIDGPSALALKELGVDPSDHRAQRVTSAMTDAADLILTADTEHRATLVQEQPLLFRRTFTLREFARLAAGLEPRRGEVDDLREHVHDVAGQRGWVEPGGPGADDIADPFGGTLDDARRCAATITAALDAVVASLRLIGDREPPI
jgi:protein-tyrosine phosphatase